jgi:hypothetical protein
MNPQPSDASPTAGTVLTFIAMTVVCIAIVVGLCVRLAEQLEPTVGDIADFSPQRVNQDAMSVDVTVKAGNRTCVLASEVIARGGGSLVVVARQASTDGAYLVHWAGSHTSNGAADCGASADLLVSRRDLLSLAGAAGGFGVHLARSGV